EEPRSWQATVGSILAHTVVILILILRPRFPTPEPSGVRESPDAQAIALPPEYRFEQTQRDRAQQIPDQPVPLGPESRNPDALVPREGEDRVDPQPADQPVQEPDQREPETTNQEPAERMERIPTPADLMAGGSIIRGPTSVLPPNSTNPRATPVGTSGARGATSVGSMGRVGMSRSDTRAWRESAPAATAAGRCVDIPSLGNNPDGTPVLASVIGIVRDNNGRPLAGAHLQIVGAPFATFSDGQGNYRLEFDPALLAKCRVQIVRVAASGYRDANLTLAIGRQVRSDDVYMRRR
ncbi:MAG TPA: hypothetical protein PLL69_12045, partial [Gemmatimonadales bacterium]|nr:hypothetical protein [Gemmatimonadales bacterium]